MDLSCRRVRHDYGVVVVSALGDAVVVVVVVVVGVVVVVVVGDVGVVPPDDHDDDGRVNFRRRAARVGATTGHTP